MQAYRLTAHERPTLICRAKRGVPAVLLFAPHFAHQCVKALVIDHSVELVAVVDRDTDVVHGDVVKLPVAALQLEPVVETDRLSAVRLDYPGSNLRIAPAV